MKKCPLFILLLALTAGVSHAVEIKGLTLGNVYDAQALADIFGNAQCPKPDDSALRNALRFNTVSCYVPISYLGLKTKAEVTLSGNWMARSLKIDIPYKRIDQIETVLITKYGKPKFKRGELEKMVPALNAGGPDQPLYARCTTWPKVQDARIRLCEKPLIVAGGPYVEYSISQESALDPNDI